MRIEDGVKLDYNNVIIVPKRSYTESRGDIDVVRKFVTKNSKQEISGFPVIAANFDTVGTFSVADKMSENGMFTSLHKYYSVEQLVAYFSNFKTNWDKVFYTIGINDKDIEKLRAVRKMLIKNFKLKDKEKEKEFIFPKLICVDVANGYTQKFIDGVRKIRKEFPKSVIMAGNVATPNMVETLLSEDVGADIIKVGIGPGCFIAGTKVLTEAGLVAIEKVEIGQRVLTHKGNWKKVVGKLEREEKKKLISINGIKSTPNHEYCILHKDIIDGDGYLFIPAPYKNKNGSSISLKGIEQLSDWVPASELSKEEHLLVKVDYVNRTFDLVEIEEIKEIEYSGSVFDLEVEDDHSYTIEGIAVHNSVCLTRIETGCGYPQLSAVIECADAAHGLNGLICADGGCAVPGDISKAFGGGADLVMLGGMFAGCDECEGERVTLENGDKVFKFYGMSSQEAKSKHNGKPNGYESAEGKCVYVKSKGPIIDVINRIKTGVIGACSMTGTMKLKDLSKRTTFVLVNQESNEVFGRNR